ncbi:MAG: hypothetical protein WCO33_00755 [bacterium]
MQISTRIKTILATIVTSLVYVAFEFGIFRLDFQGITELGRRVGVSLIIAVVLYFSIMWVVSFRLNFIRILIIPLFPALFMFLFSLFVGLTFYQGIFGVTAITLSFITTIIIVLLTYGLVLNVNILNVASFNDTLPLARAAKTAQYIFSLICNYLFFTIIYNVNISNVLRTILTLLFMFYLSFQLLWVMSLSSRINIRLTLPIGLVLFVITLAFNLWPISSEFIALLLTTCFYVIFGVALESSPKFSREVIFEYSIITFLVLFFCFLVTDWGINGRMIG